ncbi:hypothetical protein MKX01_014245, partial [Papaver californicum]
HRKLLAFCNLSPERKKKLGQPTEKRIQMKLENLGPVEILILKEQMPPGFDYAYVDAHAMRYPPNQQREAQG